MYDPALHSVPALHADWPVRSWNWFWRGSQTVHVFMFAVVATLPTAQAEHVRSDEDVKTVDEYVPEGQYDPVLHEVCPVRSWKKLFAGLQAVHASMFDAAEYVPAHELSLVTNTCTDIHNTTHQLCRLNTPCLLKL